MEVGDYLTIEKNNGVATIWLDQKGESINKVSPDVVGLFHGIMDELENDSEVKCAVLTSRKKDFIAGADIDAFAHVNQPGDFVPILQKGHEILNRMERSKKPVVAAIHGTCYGAGLEIALACKARVCSDHKSTKMALPEVKLGLLPGGGGTQRLPRLVGLQKSLDMMLTGKNIFARQAKRIGLVDEVTNKNKLHAVATQMALKMVEKPISRKRKKKLFDKILDDTSIGRSIVFKKAREKVHKMTQGNYPAVPEIINCIETGYKNGQKAGLEAEATKFESLILTDASRGLISLFFGMTDKKKNPMPEKVKKLNTLGMLGAGFMGAGIAEVSILNDIDVLLKDIKEETIQEARKGIWKSIDKKLKRKALSKTEAEKIMNRVAGRLDYADYQHADVVIEAVIEDMDLKKKIIKEVENNCKQDVIFATNTSALPITDMGNEAKKPENIIGMHYFSPVPKMPLLEIVVTEKTADWVIASCYDLGVRQGKTCIVVKDGPGFYANRILAPYLNECLLMLEEGADLASLDKALKKKGMPVGPIALMDEVGIDVGAHVMSGDLSKMARGREGAKISDAIPKLFKAGYYGRKNKKGFYQYDAKTGKRGKPNQEVYGFFGGGSRVSFDVTEMQNRALMLMINEAVLCLQEQVIQNPSDGDIGAVFGLGFLPFTGGPFRYIDQVGAAKMVDIMEELATRISPRFKPVELLKEKAKKEEKFHG